MSFHDVFEHFLTQELEACNEFAHETAFMLAMSLAWIVEE